MVLDGKITDAKSIIGIFLADKIISGTINIDYKNQKDFQIFSS